MRVLYTYMYPAVMIQSHQSIAHKVAKWRQIDPVKNEPVSPVTLCSNSKGWQKRMASGVTKITK